MSLLSEIFRRRRSELEVGGPEAYAKPSGSARVKTSQQLIGRGTNANLPPTREVTDADL